MAVRLAFAAIIAWSLLAAPLAAAQQVERVSRIGVLGIGTPTERSARFQLFQQELRDLGHSEGRNIAFEFRWVEGSAEQLVAAAGSLVDLKVDLIVATSTPAALAAQRATRAVPVVFVTAADPVGSGLVASIGRPGGNITGVSLLAPEIVGRQMQLLKEALPRVSRVVILSNPSNQYDASLVREVESAARSMGIRIRVLGVPASEALEGTLAATAKERADALFVLFDPLMFTHRARIADFASRRRLPAGGAADEVRAGHQPTGGGRPGPHDPALVAAAGGRGHQVSARASPEAHRP